MTDFFPSWHQQMIELTNKFTLPDRNLGQKPKSSFFDDSVTDSIAADSDADLYSQLVIEAPEQETRKGKSNKSHNRKLKTYESMESSSTSFSCESSALSRDMSEGTEGVDERDDNGKVDHAMYSGGASTEDYTEASGDETRTNGEDESTVDRDEASSRRDHDTLSFLNFDTFSYGDGMSMFDDETPNSRSNRNGNTRFGKSKDIEDIIKSLNRKQDEDVAQTSPKQKKKGLRRAIVKLFSRKKVNKE